MRAGWPRERIVGTAHGDSRPGYPWPAGRYDDGPMRRAPFVLGCLALLVMPIGSAYAANQVNEPTPVDVITVDGPIDRVLLAYVRHRLHEAEDRGAIVVLQLDTPGALDEDGVALADEVANLSAPVLAWVGPVPAKASGTGLLLLYASSLGAIAPGSQTGPLDPVDLAAPDARPPDLLATIQGWLDARGKSTKLVRLDEALPALDALHLGIAQIPALSVPDLLNRVDGMSVRTPSGEVVLHTRIATDEQQVQHGEVDIRFANMGPAGRVLHAVSTPSFVYVLLVLGLAGLAFELTQPGFGFAGFAGLLLLALAIYGLTVVPISPLGLGLLVGGIGLLALDVWLRRLGILSALGLLAFAAGSVVAFSGLGDELHISPWLIGGAVVASFLYYGFALTVALQSRDRIVATQRGLIGLVGEARGRLAPDGPVFVKGALWRGRSTGEPIESGSPVRVRGVDGLILQVEAEARAGSGFADGE